MRGSAGQGRGIFRMVTSNVVLFSLAAMAITSGIIMAFAFRSHHAAVSGSLSLVARYAANRAERFIGGQIDFLEAASWLEGASLRADCASAELLDGVLGFNPAILQLAAVDRRSGDFLGQSSRRSAAAARASGLRFARDAAGRAGAGRPYMSPVFIDAVTDEPLITLGVAPFERFESQDIILVAELNLKFMWELVADLDAETGGRAYVVDSSGSLVAYGDPSRVLAHESLARLPAVAAFMSAGQSRASGKLLTFRGIEGDLVVGTYTGLEYPPWAVVVELPWALAYREAIQALAFGLASVAAMTAAIYLVGLMLAKRLSSPIVSLAGAVSGMAARGEIIPVEASGPNEVAGLALAFNSMADRLNRNEQRFQRLIWNSNDIIAVADAGGTLSYVSASIERIFGYPPAEAVGKALADYLLADDAGKAARAFASLSRTAGAIERAILRLVARDGRIAEVEMIGVNLVEDPDIGGIVLNLRDVSERMDAERERARLQDRLQHAMKMEAIGRLAGGIAHDFNNLLTGIYGSVQLMRMDAEDPVKVEYYLNEIKREAESAASLTRQLLAYSRKQPIEAKLVDLNALIMDVGGMLERLIGEDIAIEYALSPGLGPVRLDPGQFQQVLVNLSANARDAMPGGGKLVIRTEELVLDRRDFSSREGLRPGRVIKLTVQDTGRGMDSEALRHLFEPFYTTKAIGKGTGLGLAMVYGAVRQSGGTIEALSEPGRGTTFTILLPMGAGDAEGFDLAHPEGDPPRGDEAVLLVEDTASVMEVAARMLERLGYAVFRAGGGEEAMRTLESSAAIDVLVTDVSMPVMGGVELAKRAKALRPGMKVLFVSGYAEEALASSIEELGRFLLKPYTMQSLAAKLRETLDEA